MRCLRIGFSGITLARLRDRCEGIVVAFEEAVEREVDCLVDWVGNWMDDWLTNWPTDG